MAGYKRSSKTENHGRDGGDSRRNRNRDRGSTTSSLDDKLKLEFERLWKYITLEMDPNMVVLGLNRNLDMFREKSSHPFSVSTKTLEMESDIVIAMVLVLGEKVCSNQVTMKTMQISVLEAAVTCELFRKRLIEKCEKFFLTGSLNGIKRSRRGQSKFTTLPTDERVFSSLVNFCKTVQEKIPKKAFVFLGFVLPKLESALKEATELFVESKYDDVYKAVQEAMNDFNSNKSSNDPANLKRNMNGHVGDFRQLSVYPSEEELRNTEPVPIRANIISGAYEDADHYLDVQYRLLREDFIRPLRTGLQKLLDPQNRTLRRKEPSVDSLRIFYNVTARYTDVDKGFVIYGMELDSAAISGVDWKRSNIMMSGSLLVLSSDGFKTLFCATVHRRDDETLTQNAIIHITLVNDLSYSGAIELNEDYTLIDYDVFFEAYRHTLQVLSEIHLEEFSLAKFIVEASADVGAPKYLRNASEYFVGTKQIQPLENESWPTPEELGMDPKQHAAYVACLTKEFAIVQGPPGTGKTYLGLRVVDTLLHNRQLWRSTSDRGPILVVCYTNHALDQFLEGILKIFQKRKETPSLIRVGGMCKSSALQPYTFQELRNSSDSLVRMPPGFSVERNQAYGKLRSLENDVEKMQLELIELESMTGVFVLQALAFKEATGGTFGPGWLDRLADPVWFGFSTVLFDKNITADEIIREWFPDCNPKGVSSEGFQIGSIPRLVQKEVTEATDKLEHFTKALENLQNQQVEEWRIQYVRDQIKDYKDELKRLNLFAVCVDKILKLYKSKRLLLPDVSFCNYPAESDPVPEKWAFYFKAVAHCLEVGKKSIVKAQEDLEAQRRHLQEYLNYGDGKLLAQSLVIGMTTTGAAKYNDLLKMASPPILIVEEAAEVLEAHVVASITHSCQQLILIGDHQQLRPSTSVYDLAVNFNLEISLFERMVKNDLNCYQLNVQHRMRPEISDLVTGPIYSDLKNAANVYKYDPVKGMVHNLYFLTHDEDEAEVAFSKSKFNSFESQFTVQLYRYLIFQGYTKEQITVLCTYTQQVTEIEKALKQLDIFEKLYPPNPYAPIDENEKLFQVFSVDSFQGEENDVIILSLVRSNDEGRIGFLSIDNRVCVALTRARHGLYVIGNLSQLSDNSPTWYQIKQKLEKQKMMGTELPLRCTMHSEVINVGSVQDFESLSSLGGCSRRCKGKLPCGHKCKLPCHGIGRNHIPELVEREDDYKCRKTVRVKLPCNHVKDCLCCNRAAVKVLNANGCDEDVTAKCKKCPNTITALCRLAKDPNKPLQCPTCMSENPLEVAWDDIFGSSDNCTTDSDADSDTDAGDGADSATDEIDATFSANLSQSSESLYPYATFVPGRHENIHDLSFDCGHFKQNGLESACPYPCGMKLACGHKCPKDCSSPMCGPCVVQDCPYTLMFQSYRSS